MAIFKKIGFNLFGAFNSAPNKTWRIASPTQQKEIRELYDSLEISDKWELFTPDDEWMDDEYQGAEYYAYDKRKQPKEKENRGGQREGTGAKKVNGRQHLWTIPSDIEEIAKEKGTAYLWECVRFKEKFDNFNSKGMKATIKTYKTNAEVFYNSKNITINYDFTPDFFESKEDVEDFAKDALIEIEGAENYDDIKLSLEIALDAFRA